MDNAQTFDSGFEIFCSLPSSIIQLSSDARWNYLIAVCEDGIYKINPNGTCEKVTWH